MRVVVNHRRLTKAQAFELELEITSVFTHAWATSVVCIEGSSDGCYVWSIQVAIHETCPDQDRVASLVEEY